MARPPSQFITSSVNVAANSVSNFFVIVAPEAAQAEAGALFHRGLQVAQQLRRQAPSDLVETAWARVAVFARQNGSGAELARDVATGSWLLAAGTWFHANGYATGAERRLLARVLEVGVERVADELEGFFVIAFGDGRARDVSIITDLIGSRHCFARVCDAGTALSASSLLLAGLGDTTLDEVGCEEFLRTGIIYEDRTFFRQVRKLAPASVLRFAAGQLHGARRYWRMAELEPNKYHGAAAVRVLSERLVNVARRISQVFAPPVCDLTGGYDSRAVVAAFQSAGVDFATTVVGTATDDDVVIAQGLAAMTGQPHWHLENERAESLAPLKEALPLTDGECDLVDYARIRALHQRLAARFAVSINGSFGEVARGYWWDLLWPRIGARQPLDTRKLAAHRYATEPDSGQLFPLGAGLDLVSHVSALIDRANAELQGWPNTGQMDNAYLTLRMQRWQGRVASGTDQIWPCLSPFMLRSVLEMMLQTDARQRRHSLLTRQVIMSLQPQLAAYPLERGHPALPLTTGTWPHFLPALPDYVRQTGRKMARRFGWQDAGWSAQRAFRLGLWRNEELRVTLQPTAMCVSELIDRTRLRAFLTESQQAHFPFALQWQRLLSLELTLRLWRELVSQNMTLSANKMLSVGQ